MSEPKENAAPPAAAVKPSKGKVFLYRSASTLLLWTVVLSPALFHGKRLGDYSFVLILMVLSVLGLLEFYKLASSKGHLCFRWMGVFCGLILREHFLLPDRYWEKVRPPPGPMILKRPFWFSSPGALCTPALCNNPQGLFSVALLPGPDVRPQALVCQKIYFSPASLGFSTSLFHPRDQVQRYGRLPGRLPHQQTQSHPRISRQNLGGSGRCRPFRWPGSLSIIFHGHIRGTLYHALSWGSS